MEFRLADATRITGPYDLIALFDCWHDTADPLGVAKAARVELAEDGCVLAVEPFANDRLEDNFTPLGRFGYAISTLVCTPCSISGGGPGLGAQAGEARTRELFTEAGFGIVRRAAETPLNIVCEARAGLREHVLVRRAWSRPWAPEFLGTVRASTSQPRWLRRSRPPRRVWVRR